MARLRERASPDQQGVGRRAVNMADNTQPALLDAIRAQLHNLEETIGGS